MNGGFELIQEVDGKGTILPTPEDLKAALDDDQE